MNSKSNYKKATDLTANNLKTVAKTISAQKLSRMTLPEVEAVVDLVSKIVPAGNVPGMILSGLARLPDRRIPVQKVQQDISALFSGVEQILDRAVYAAFFAGPASILWGYQNLLRLAGKDLEISFPEGIWQFYVNYALREDTARHANETHGFDTLLKQHDIHLNSVDRLTAWIMAAVTCLHQFSELLANEWYERTAIALLKDVTLSLPNAAGYAGLYRSWEAQKPYRREADAAEYDYPSYRRLKFESFLNNAFDTLPAQLHSSWESKLRKSIEEDLPAYQRQMSILAYLDPGLYGETRVPFDITKAQIGLIHRGNYYLLPACEQNEKSPINVLTVRSQIASLMKSPHAAPAQLTPLALIQRAAQPSLRQKLNPMFVRDLESLRFAPIIINSDLRSRFIPLSGLRQTERGIGDNALTIFDAGETFVFDQSHIFFDGAWGAAIAEIMTNEALSWARYLDLLPEQPAAGAQIYTALSFPLHKDDHELIRKAPRISPEAGADTDKANLKACMDLRRLFKQRNDLIQLTINDLLVLYRAIHAATYHPSPALLAELKRLAKENKELELVIRQALDGSNQVNPSILIPIDASQRVPRDRLYPMNIEVPLAELDILNLHRQTIQALDSYESEKTDYGSAYSKFDQLQRLYLASLAGIGMIMSKAKGIAIQGESASVGAIKLLAHLPNIIQRLLDKIPERFELLNNIIKGREVISNVGAVSPASTLTRFITAKDDNNQKQLAWGVITDANGVMHISLRDFRPHVALLQEINRMDLANIITQDYLDAYAIGLNGYIQELSRITRASHESRPISGKQKGRS